MDKSIIEDISKSGGSFPFPIIVMHTVMEPHKEIHSLVAYIDKNFKCRHAEFLSGSRVFITPYIVYNPSLLQMYCMKKYDI
jgi:hypothetical protein